MAPTWSTLRPELLAPYNTNATPPPPPVDAAGSCSSLRGELPLWPAGCPAEDKPGCRVTGWGAALRLLALPARPGGPPPTPTGPPPRRPPISRGQDTSRGGGPHGRDRCQGLTWILTNLTYVLELLPNLDGWGRYRGVFCINTIPFHV